MKPDDYFSTAYIDTAQHYLGYKAEIASTNNGDDGIEVAVELLYAALGDGTRMSFEFPLDHAAGDRRRNAVELMLGLDPKRPHVDALTPVVYVPISTIVARPGERTPYIQIEYIVAPDEPGVQRVDSLMFIVPAIMPRTLNPSIL